MNEYVKLDDSTLSVVETKPSEVLPAKTYDVSFLRQQLININEQKDKDNAQRDAEIAEVETLLSESDKLGIIEKVEEVALEEIITLKKV